MVHQERDDLIHPDKCPSPLSSSDALAFGDTLMANRHTSVFWSLVILSVTAWRLMIIGATTLMEQVFSRIACSD